MTPTDSTWTDLDLERFHDSDLEPERAERLAEALRTDAALRRRLTEIASIDRLIARALEAPPVRTRNTPAAPWLWAVGLAAVLLLALVPFLLSLASRAPVASDPIARTDQPAPDTTPTPRASAVRIIASVSLTADAQVPPSLPALPAPDPVAHALDRGDLESALVQFRSLAGADRLAQARRLGDTIRSAMSAEDLLNALTPEEQLAVCEAWSAEPRLRPVTFARLRRLADDPVLGPDVSALAGRLAQAPGMIAWLRSYGLAGDLPPRG